MINRKLARKVLCGLLAVGCASVTGGAFAGSVIGQVTIDNIKITPQASTGTFSIGSDSSTLVLKIRVMQLVAMTAIITEVFWEMKSN